MVPHRLRGGRLLRASGKPRAGRGVVVAPILESETSVIHRCFIQCTINFIVVQIRILFHKVFGDILDFPFVPCL